MPYGVPYGGRGSGRAAQRPGSRRRARGGGLAALLGRLPLRLVFVAGGVWRGGFEAQSQGVAIERTPRAPGAQFGARAQPARRFRSQTEVSLA